MPQVLRLAVISTPRSGNTWVRASLARLYGLDEVAAHLPEEVDWDDFPRRCVIQIRWPPWPKFVARLERNQFRVVVMARHPLDVLMSWLNLASYSHMDGVCHGEACRECAIVGLTLERAKHRKMVEHLEALKRQIDWAARALDEEQYAHARTRRAPDEILSPTDAVPLPTG